MPSFQMDQPPVVAARGDAEALRQYIVLLVDRLKYVLNHLDDENIQSVSATKIGRRMGTMADALGEKGTDNERVRQMVRELTMTTFKSADIDWNQMKGFDRAVETAVQVIMEALQDGIDSLSDRVDDIEAALEALRAMTEGEIARLEAMIPTETATTTANGLMSATDKAKLDGIEAEANAYTHPAYTARTGQPTANKTPGFGETFTVSQIKSDATGHVTAATNRTVKIPDTEATQSAAGLMSSTDKAKLDAFGAASTYALKTDLTAVYRYKGSKATVSALPSADNVQGDVWDVQETGMNYAWNGSAWDALGMIYTPDIITDAQVDAICV